MLKFYPRPMFWLLLFTLCFCTYAFAQTGASTSTLPSGGEIKDWATIGVILTALISVLNKAIGVFYKGEMSEVAKRAIAGVVCLGAAVWYGAQNGYFAEFNPRNAASIIASIGIITTVAKNFYDGLSQPVGKVLKNPSEAKAAPVSVPGKAEKINDKIDKVQEIATTAAAVIGLLKDQGHAQSLQPQALVSQSIAPQSDDFGALKSELLEDNEPVLDVDTSPADNTLAHQQV